MNQIWVAGEALIDIFPEANQVVVGGAAANTAKALGALEQNVHFIGGISDDQFGKLIRREFEAFKVKLDFASNSSLPTATAEIELDKSASANYIFNLEQTATFSFDRNWLPLGNPKLLHIGSLSCVIEPGGSELFSWAKEKNCPIIFDPNIRSSVIQDREFYKSKVLPWLKISKIIKLSNEDLEYLELTLGELFDLGVDLVVLTRGIEGISAITKRLRIDTPAREVSVIDTIGAGDTVGAITAEVLSEEFDFGQDNLNKLINRAAIAASITCSRKGATPPRKSELETISR